MQSVREWALAVCFACIALGILQQFVNIKGNFSVIKLVMTLYILITAFAPINFNDDISIDLNNYYNEENIEMNSQELVLNTTKINLQQKILQELQANNVIVNGVSVNLNTEDYLSISSVTIYVSSQTDIESAKKYALIAIDTDVPIEIISEE